jgi:hypothetical protein
MWLAPAVNAAGGQPPSRAAVQRQERHLIAELREMNGRLDRRHPAQRDVVADSERLRAGIAALAYTGAERSPDDRLGQQLAAQAFSWIARASDQFHWDPQVAPALMRTYQFLGEHYQRYPASYRPYLLSGYAGASRMALALVLSPGTGADYETALEALSLDLVALNAVAQRQGVLALPPSGPAAASDAAPAPGRPMAVPLLDESTLTAAERERWADVRTRFRDVAIRVYQANVALDQLAARLRTQNLTLNAGDAVTALKMQGFLEDAAELVRARLFERAEEALRRADYERARLKNVTGQS